MDSVIMAWVQDQIQKFREEIYAAIETRFSDVPAAEDTGGLRAEVAMLRGSVDTLLANVAAPAIIVAEGGEEPGEEMATVVEAAEAVAEAAAEVAVAAADAAVTAVEETLAEPEETEPTEPATPVSDTPVERGGFWTRKLFG